MKFLKTSAICVLLTVCYIQSTAQSKMVPLREPDYKKPKLFADLPEKFVINTQALDALFNDESGKSINVSLAANYKFHGVIVSRATDNTANSKSVVLRSTDRIGATFSLTKFDNPDGSFNYVGRIISREHIDAYEIAKEGSQFVLRKKGLYDLIND